VLGAFALEQLLEQHDTEAEQQDDGPRDERPSAPPMWRISVGPAVAGYLGAVRETNRRA
jgi:hypothetical protein